VLLLALKQLVTSGLPLLTADNSVIRHRALSPAPVMSVLQFCRVSCGFRSACLAAY
jgi:hypothetical protein